MNRKEFHDEIIARTISDLDRPSKWVNQWSWDATKPHSQEKSKYAYVERPPKEIPQVHDRSAKLFNITFTEYWPGKKLPTGWSFLWHKWNWGFTLHHYQGLTFTIAKIAGKWRMNTHTDPFMQASFDACPLVSAEEWSAMKSMREDILDKPT